ncbi:MAG: glycosyltransferase family 4 protein [Rubrivivax sp.]|nr:glycosyltransferase family 4 protein [Rubrivivax sp.]MBP6465564.1 glycosyltransferase family 4 protein [Rubrivivax sp.]
MNVLYINHYAGGPAYGMEYRCHYLAREWQRAGHRVAIVGASQSHLRSRQPAVAGDFASETVDGVDFVWCRTPAYQGNGVGRVINIAAFLRRLGQWRRWLDFVPDVVIASSTYPADIWPARRLARRYGATLVWEVHDLWPLSPMELGGMSARHPFIVWMQAAENAACRSADVVVSMLPMAGAHLRAHGMAAEKFVHVPNGIDPAEWAGPPAALPAAHAQALQQARERGHFVVGYTGAHGLANALDSMLDAAALARHEPVTWLLVGTGPAKAALQRRVAAEGLANVQMLDAVPKAAIPALLATMDGLYIGLQREPLFRFGISPNKLMDYMMAARPVVCAIEAGNDIVGDAGCGLTIAPEDPAALAAAVRRLREMPAAAREAMGRAGRGYVEQQHTYPVLARQFLQALPAMKDRGQAAPA